jgi:predicted enzyme related to lactoylglutathione lyase
MAKVSWFEVLGQDVDGLKKFYGSLFGWQFEDVPGMEYGLAKNTDGVPGGVGRAPQGPGWATFYVKVDDVQATVDAAVARGGRMLMPVTSVGGGTLVAVIADPEGHPVGLSSGM